MHRSPQTEPMSYGVIASKAGRLLVEAPQNAGGEESDEALERFLSDWGPVWVPGRLTLTKLHLVFTPGGAGLGRDTLNLSLRDISSIELSRPRWSAQIVLRTATHQTRLRLVGATTLAGQIAERTDVARRLPRRITG